MQTREREIRRENLRRIRRDQLRPLRVVKKLDCSAVLEKCPIEVREASVVSDRDTGELFLSILFRSLARKQLTALEICVLLYRENACVPYEKLPFRYGSEEGTFGERMIGDRVRTKKECRMDPLPICGEVFGRGIYLPLPDSYFHKLHIRLLGVEYRDGSKEKLDLIANSKAQQFAELDYLLQAAYSHINAFDQAEYQHPIRVLPTMGENAWLCCCGQKNLAQATKCERCKRDRDWQLEHLTSEQLLSDQKRLDESHDVRLLKDTSAYPQNRYQETAEERKEKELAFKRYQEKCELQEKLQEERRSHYWRTRWELAGITLLIFLGIILYVAIYIVKNN